MRLAFFTIYDGAVYLHMGREYLITKLDLSSCGGQRNLASLADTRRRTALAEPCNLPYYTVMRDHKDVLTRAVVNVGPLHPDSFTGHSYQSRATPLADVVPDAKKPRRRGTLLMQPEAPWFPSGVQYGGARIRTHFRGFRKINKKTKVAFETVELDLPDGEFDTVAFWMPIPKVRGGR